MKISSIEYFVILGIIVTIPMDVHHEKPKSQKRIRMTFTPEEDDRLREFVSEYGEKDWSRVEARLPWRDRRQCRERWFSYLSPRVSNGPWTREEEKLLGRKIEELGQKWKMMESAFPGRTDVNIKNHWKYMKKSEVSRGHRKDLDPEKDEGDDIFKKLVLLFDAGSELNAEQFAELKPGFVF
jgi:hypothetical protein